MLSIVKKGQYSDHHKQAKKGAHDQKLPDQELKLGLSQGGVCENEKNSETLTIATHSFSTIPGQLFIVFLSFTSDKKRYVLPEENNNKWMLVQKTVYQINRVKKTPRSYKHSNIQIFSKAHKPW